MMTDEANHYTEVGQELAGHGRVNHSIGEYVIRRDVTIHTNTIEGYFSIFKRGMKGVYQHCGEKHLTAISPSSISATTTVSGLASMITGRPKAALARREEGKRLTYRRTDWAAFV